MFDEWLRAAVHAGVPEPHAAALATLDADGVPDARTLIIKEVSEQGWAFAGPRSSRKGSQLAAHPVAALNFWGQPVVRGSPDRRHTRIVFLREGGAWDRTHDIAGPRAG